MPSDQPIVIIGSGASGGMAAYVLTKLGIPCVMLEAGPMLDLQRHRVLKPVFDLPYRGFGRPGRFPHVVQASEFDANLWADERQNPYTYDPGNQYNWVRIRLTGGKTLRWGRASWRLSDYEFKCHDHDGASDNWPVSYKDLAPYYDRAEPIFRVSGRKEGFPQLPDGTFLEDSSTDSICVQRFLARRKMNVPTTKQRRSPVPGRVPSEPASSRGGGDRQSEARHQCSRPADHDGQKHGSVNGVRSSIAVEKGEYDSGARAGSWRVTLESSRLSAQLRTGEFQRGSGTLYFRSVLREGRGERDCS